MADAAARVATDYRNDYRQKWPNACLGQGSHGLERAEESGVYFDGNHHLIIQV